MFFVVRLDYVQETTWQSRLIFVHHCDFSFIISLLFFYYCSISTILKAIALEQDASSRSENLYTSSGKRG